MSDSHTSVPASRINKVVLVGRDLALWLAANVLWTSFHRAGLEIVIVELPSQLRYSEVVPTLQNQQAFHAMIGLQERPLMSTTQATYSLGQRFVDFSLGAPSFIHGYGAYGRPINSVPFHQYWVKARAKGLPLAFDDFSLSAVAARQGQFFKPDAETDRIGECDYGYHIPAVSYRHVLKQIALQKGMSCVEATVDGIQRSAESGLIEAVHLSSGQTVTGDFFVDATGTESLLLGGTLETPFESWSTWFPCDRLLIANGPGLNPLPPFSQISAFHAGWTGLFPLPKWTAVQLAYASLDMDEDAALASAASATAMRLGTESMIAPLNPGRRRLLWSGNCVAVGESAAAFDPIDSVGLHATMAGLAHLITLFPIDTDMSAERDEYNRNIISTYERIRDYQICHYRLNKRYGQRLWDQARDTVLPDALAYKIDLFEARGHLVEYDEETFDSHDWYSTFIGHGLIPRAYDPAVDRATDSEIIPQLQQILNAIKGQVVRMKPMETYLAPPVRSPASAGA